jgi:hypothetical protein
MNGELENAKGRRFRWGLLLAWTPFVLVVVPGVSKAFRGVSEQSAVGVGAIAAAMAGSYATFGLIVSLVFQVSAIVLLFRTFSKEHFARGLVSVVSICCSGLTLFLSGLFLWLVWIQAARHPS